MSTDSSEGVTHCDSTSVDQNYCRFGDVHGSIRRMEELLDRGQNLLYDDNESEADNVPGIANQAVQNGGGVTNLVVKPLADTSQTSSVTHGKYLCARQSLHTAEAHSACKVGENSGAGIGALCCRRHLSGAPSERTRRGTRTKPNEDMRCDDMENASITDIRRRIRSELEECRRRNQMVPKKTPNVVAPGQQVEQMPTRRRVGEATASRRCMSRSLQPPSKPQTMNGTASHPREQGRILHNNNNNNTHLTNNRNLSSSHNKSSPLGDHTRVPRWMALYNYAYKLQMKREQLVSQERREEKAPAFKVGLYSRASMTRRPLPKTLFLSMVGRSATMKGIDLTRPPGAGRFSPSPSPLRRGESHQKTPVEEKGLGHAPNGVAPPKRAKRHLIRALDLGNNLQTNESGGKRTSSHQFPKKDTLPHPVGCSSASNAVTDLQSEDGARANEKAKASGVSAPETHTVLPHASDSIIQASQSSSLIFWDETYIHPLVKPLNLSALRK